MKLKVIGLLSIIVMIAFSSCYYDKADLLYPTPSGACDTTGAVSYNQQILPLLQQYCYSCHSGSNPSGGITVGNYAADKAIAINGKLYGSISYASGYTAMPEAAAKLSDCQIATVKKWIDENSPNN
jgi:mono/diheme cytochrome c family protein